MLFQLIRNLYAAVYFPYNLNKEVVAEVLLVIQLIPGSYLNCPVRLLVFAQLRLISVRNFHYNEVKYTNTLIAPVHIRKNELENIYKRIKS